MVGSMFDFPQHSVTDCVVTDYGYFGNNFIQSTRPETPVLAPLKSRSRRLLQMPNEGLVCNRLSQILTNNCSRIFSNHPNYWYHTTKLGSESIGHLGARERDFWGIIVFKCSLAPESQHAQKRRQLRLEASCWLKKNVQK